MPLAAHAVDARVISPSAARKMHASTMTCPTCGIANRAGAKFCVNCGAALALACPTCGTPYQTGDRFCAECGATLGRTPPPAAPSGTAADQPRQGIVAGGVAQRRHVSVLFADLVGFTARSEERDPEETREFLSRYFETAQRIVERYGGTIEKFIGDAVMAVWGAPMAHEDDAERAVRAALELVDSVAGLSETAGGTDPLALRAGILTGEAAVTVGATNQGMVAGDLVNTASRLQSVATPGTVLVGEATWRATEAAIAYEPVGEQDLKGKAAPVAAWRALRVLGGRGGALRYEGLEAPFVGRDREFRLIRDLLHASGTDGKAQLVSVIGQAGIGKSRLAWELFKHIDGLSDRLWWHQGRCLAYGDGVTYWALADMVRMRARIVEGEEAESARAKLKETAAEHIPDVEERAWIEPRLAHLLGLEEISGAEKQDLFGAWRLFFERLSAESPVVMVFEDMQWADPALIEFVEHLLDWSRNAPIFVLSLARPELASRHPDFGRSSRNFTSISLEPLPAEAMRSLLHGLVPGIPDELETRILGRAEGVPMYAVETVRMLIDRGLLARDGAAYRLSGDVVELEVPESLHALIAARLDGLAPDERTVVQDASVLGKSFSVDGLAALSGWPTERLEPLLAALVRKEILDLEVDPRSPERGQHTFLQDLVRAVAYEGLSHRDRRRKHLAAAEYLEASRAADLDEIAEVVASHYLDAYRLDPGAPDADAVRERARSLLTRAGDRAASLAAPDAAQRLYGHAVELADDPIEAAALRARVGDMATLQAKLDEAEAAYGAAIDGYAAAGRDFDAARVAATLAEVEYRAGTSERALARLEGAVDVLARAPISVEFAHAVASLAGSRFFTGRVDEAVKESQRALDAAEQLGDGAAIAHALGIRAVIARSQGRPNESVALTQHAVTLMMETEALPASANLFINLGDLRHSIDRFAESLDAYEQGLAFTRRRGDRPREWFMRSEKTFPLTLLGRWDEALVDIEAIPEEMVVTLGYMTHVTMAAEIFVARGQREQAEHQLELIGAYETSADFQERGVWGITAARVRRAAGDLEGALRAAEFGLDHRMDEMHDQVAREGFVEVMEAALAVGQLETAEEYLDRAERLGPGLRPRYVTAHARRFRGRLVDAGVGDGSGGGSADEAYVAAESEFRALKLPFWLAVTLLEHAESLARRGVSDDARRSEATAIFEQLKATPWVERARSAGVATPVSG